MQAQLITPEMLHLIAQLDEPKRDYSKISPFGLLLEYSWIHFAYERLRKTPNPH